MCNSYDKIIINCSFLKHLFAKADIWVKDGVPSHRRISTRRGQVYTRSPNARLRLALARAMSDSDRAAIRRRHSSSFTQSSTNNDMLVLARDKPWLYPATRGAFRASTLIAIFAKRILRINRHAGACPSHIRHFLIHHSSIPSFQHSITPHPCGRARPAALPDCRDSHRGHWTIRSGQPAGRRYLRRKRRRWRPEFPHVRARIPCPYRQW
jgi:hypothetical protein